MLDRAIADTTTQVGAWLAPNNLTSLPLTATGEWIPVNATVSQDNQLLSTEFSTFRNMDTNQTVERTLPYSIPGFPVATVSAGNNTAIAQAAGPNRPVASVSAVCRSNSSWSPRGWIFGGKLPVPTSQPFAKLIIQAVDVQTTVGLATGVSVAFLSTGSCLFAMRTPNSLLGVSYIVASGDFGSGFPVGNCASFDASFPATCPFVIAVGGTEFIVDAVTEAAWVSSDGSFSNIFQRAKYQDAAVEAYFRTVGANASSPFNVSGRAENLALLPLQWLQPSPQKSQKVRERDKNPPPMAEREDLDAQYLRFSDGKEGVAKILEYMKTSGADGDEGE
ncbi:hypothetical protein B0H14DRAFT_2573456 [Mycena olivaceomarginata]|nr:hypothetical protein B0H14DRAFT_2573456 [Mycena olivaceomarginata]